jgi:hypothetical protein
VLEALARACEKSGLQKQSAGIEQISDVLSCLAMLTKLIAGFQKARKIASLGQYSSAFEESENGCHYPQRSWLGCISQKDKDIAPPVTLPDLLHHQMK